MADVDASSINIMWEVPNKCAKQTEKLTVVHEFRQKFQYAIGTNGKPEQSSTKKPASLSHRRDTLLTHHYSITNAGPSKTNKPYEFQLYVPNIVPPNNVHIKLEPLQVPQIQCNKAIKGEQIKITGIPSTKKDISCTNTKCFVYHCKVEKGWDVSQEKTITIETKLPKAEYQKIKKILPQSTGNFWTALAKEDGMTPHLLTFKTKLIYDDAGGWRTQLATYWPILIGVFIGVVVFVSVFYALYKTGTLNKIRFWSRDENEPLIGDNKPAGPNTYRMSTHSANAM